MWPGEVESVVSVKLRESAHWVLSQGGASPGFQFSVCPELNGFPEQISCVPTGQAVLHGDRFFTFNLANSEQYRKGAFEFLENKDFLAGAGRIKVSPENLESSSFDIYRQMLDRAGDRPICRIWNYVPGINEVNAGLIENYKLFCSGRAEAFETVFGDESPRHFPAASATGTKSKHLTVIFIATHSTVENWENPEQTPAYRYPIEYGPRPPAFARASRFTDPAGLEWIFISGTAAIKGYVTMHRGNFSRQLDTTLENVDIVLKKCGMRLEDCDSGRRRYFKVFLRNRNDLPSLLERMRTVIKPLDSLTVVEGDICRSDLVVEVELTVFPFQS